MDTVAFKDEMVKTRRALIWATVLLALLGLAGGLMFFLADESWHPAVAIVAGVASALFLVLLVVLWIYYLSRAESREKRGLRRQVNRLEKDLAAAQDSLAEAFGETGRVQKRAEEERERETSVRRARIQEWEGKAAAAETAMGQELQAALAALQKEHVDAGLRAMTLDPVHVPGVGDAMAGKLHESGILTAYDVSEGAIRQIEGFGESKTLSLLRWRESVAYAAQDTQPEALPEEQRAAIEEKGRAEIAALDAERERAQGELEQVMERLRAREAQDMAAASAREIAARERLARLEPEKRAAETSLVGYRGIRFSRMVISALSRGATSWQKRLGPWLAWILFALLGLANLVLLAVTLYLLFWPRTP
ncbi:MAG TPA: hypothetical protein PKO09_03475 [Anaerolineae bacterium]|nr:hypothetical protein [Anaerolineae bacterium]